MSKTARTLGLVAGLICLVFLMFFMSGVFRSGRISPDDTVDEITVGKTMTTSTVEVSQREISQTYEAVGTVAPRTEASISARVSARILSIAVQPGAFVKKNQPLIYLDDREARARLDQTRQALLAAEAELARAEQARVGAQAAEQQASQHYRRIKGYYENQTATKQDLEQAVSGFEQAQAAKEQADRAVEAAAAGVARARKVVEESEIALEYYVIDAPVDGQVARRLIDPGDMAWPGKPLLVIQTAGALRLVASVREGLINRITPDMELEVVIDAVNIRLQGRVEEIEPSADSASRTFVVKVGIPSARGLYPGMFGRLFIPLPSRHAILVPRDAVRRTGQLEMVLLEGENGWREVYVQTGRSFDDGMVEILSGLTGGETVARHGYPTEPGAGR